MAAPMFEFGAKNGVQNLQSRVSLLELENQEKKKIIGEKSAEHEKLRKLYEKALAQLQTQANSTTTMSEEERDNLLGQIRSLNEDIEEKERQNVDLESKAEEFQKQVKAEQAKIADRETLLKRYRDEEDKREAYIKEVEETAHGLQIKVDQLEKDKTHLDSQLAQAREDTSAEKQARTNLEKVFGDARHDNDNLRSQLNAANIQKARHLEENEAHTETLQALQDAQLALAEEQKLTAALRTELGKLREETPRFDLNPSAHVAPAGADGQPKTPRSLANELEELNSLSGSSRESGEESDAASTAKASRKGSSSASDADEDEGKTEAIQIIKTVKVPGPTVRIYVPYQTYAHNPFICWFLTEFNIIVLFCTWLVWAAGRAAPLLRKLLGTQAYASATSSPAHQHPNGGIPQVPTRTDGAAPAGECQNATNGALSSPVNGQVGTHSPDNTNSSTTPSPVSAQPTSPEYEVTGADPPTPLSQAATTQPAPASPQGSDGQSIATEPFLTVSPSSQAPALANIADTLGPAPQAGSSPTTNGSSSLLLNGVNTAPAPTGGENGATAPAQNGANSSSSPSSFDGDSDLPTMAVLTAPGTDGDQQNPAPQTPINKELADLIGPVAPVEDNRETIPPGENLGPDANDPRFPRTRWWSPYVDPNIPPNASQTIFSMILHLIFYYGLWVCYSNYNEREIWLAANEATRILLVDILALRTRSGRGLASLLFSENVVRRMDHFILVFFELFDIKTQAYKIPG